jgi:phosphoribosylaminoimidazolecarboxamide formyltransferase/IMP cyclohydrolase
VRALLSVYDKTGVEALARGLVALGWEIVSSGGTSAALAEAGVDHIQLASLTGFAEMLDHRVVTLHPAVHGGILADRSKPQHMADLVEHGIAPIDLVVVNLYPFRASPSIEMIDVGGPTMVRAAAKNHAHVGIVVDPADYGPVLDELRREGQLSAATRARLARAAFAHTAAYDAAIVGWLDETSSGASAGATPGAKAGGQPGEGAYLPPTIHLALERVQELRYGENPHQQGARYRDIGRPGWWDSVTQHGGMALSYLNLFDADAAWRLVHELGEQPTVAIIKHANPCGVALADDIATAYVRAFESDPMSAFGGIVALNRPVSAELAADIAANPKADVLIAPGFDEGVLELFGSKRKNMRVLEASPPEAVRFDLRQLGVGFLVQQPDRFESQRESWRVATKVAPSAEQWRDLELAWRICAFVKSNAITLVANGQAVGIGAGQQNRVDSAELAVKKAAGRAKGGAAASDAFFPFRDGLDMVASAGVSAVVQPGGSLRDDELIAAADEHGIAMVMTGERHFRH